jgi:hypothetical protein
MKILINTWLKAQYVNMESNEYDELSWAVDQLFDLAHNDPSTSLEIVLQILKIDSSKTVCGALGAGVLEELLVHHGEEYIDTLVELSKTNKQVNASLRFTHLDKDDVSPQVFLKYQELFINFS